MTFVDKTIWVIQTGTTNGEEFDTEEDAIARSWELTAPGDQRWAVHSTVRRVPVVGDIYAVKRMHEKKREIKFDELMPKKEKMYFFGTAYDLANLTEPGGWTGKRPEVGAVVALMRDGLLTVLRRDKKGRLVWDPVNFDEVPLKVMLDVQKAVKGSGWGEGSEVDRW